MVKQQDVERITLTVKEAMTYSGLGRNTLLRLCQSGEVAARRVGRRRWLILRASLERWLAGENGGRENNGQSK